MPLAAVPDEFQLFLRERLPREQQLKQAIRPLHKLGVNKSAREEELEDVGGPQRIDQFLQQILRRVRCACCNGRG